VADDIVPSDVREFILTHIESTASSVAAHLYIDEAQSEAVLDQLCNERLLACRDGVYWFDGDQPEQRAIVEKVSMHYAHHLIPITNLVHAKPSGARAFAAAFKLRKDRQV
jgi:hypothetical protein